MSIQNIGLGAIDAYYRNRTWVMTFELREPSGEIADLTGADVTWTLAERGTPELPLITKTNGDGLIVIDPVGGGVIVTVPDDETDFSGTYVYEILAETGAGKFTYGSGQMTIKPSITA